MAQDLEDRERDKQILIEILKDIEKRLHFIVFTYRTKIKGDSPFRQEFISLVREPWSEVAAHFEFSRELIRRDELDWRYVEGIGLTRNILDWKKRMFDETIRQGGVRRFFKVAKSMLGSLSKAVPPLEFVMEYIELVEAAMKYSRG
jgi:hypothetical protein